MFHYRDIRATNGVEERINSFSERAELFFYKFKMYAGASSVNKKPYLHIVRDHLGDMMKFWYDIMQWGYGYLDCSASEHLNKRITFLELNNTCMDDKRFYSIIRTMRLKQFIFTNCIMPSVKTIKCSACSQERHNKKNKSCPMHESQPALVFNDSEDE